MTTSDVTIDPTGLPRVAGSVPREEAARQLESLFLGLLVKEMRQTLPGEGLFGGGAGASIYEGLFDSLMGEALASGPGSGLREAILEALPEDRPIAADTSAAPMPVPVDGLVSEIGSGSGSGNPRRVSPSGRSESDRAKEVSP